jgi:hypothetical protein
VKKTYGCKFVSGANVWLQKAWRNCAEKVWLQKYGCLSMADCFALNCVALHSAVL